MQLFDTDRLPDGFQYRADFISADEQRMLVSSIERIEFSTFEMRGVVARRRVAFFGPSTRTTSARSLPSTRDGSLRAGRAGASYSSGDESQGPIPEFLTDVRARAAEWAGVHPQDFAMALINEYRAGAPIGWHRDAPQYGIIAGISLLSSCRMKLRPYVAPSAIPAKGRTAPRRTTHEITLEPRSGYLITGAARSDFEHSIPSTTALRYSITFRTLR